VRNQAVEADHWMDRSNFYAIDVVHKDFFEAYVTDHALPFAERFSAKALKHSIEVISGKAFIPDLRAKGPGAFDKMGASIYLA
jgi:hypothetical protein